MSGTRIWQPGEVVLDLYEVRDVLHGGMGVVHRVRHRGWDLDLAVKTPRWELAGNQAVMADFEAEANHWVELGLHPNVVNCVYVRRVDQVPRVFAEWVDGGSLADAVAGGRLYANGPDGVLGRVLDTAIQVAWGLDHAHRQGLVHQDVKPANVLLATDGTVKVTDFGLARTLTVAAGSDVGARFAGLTPAYCSPEQNRAAAGDPGIGLTAATDVWSWALTVLEMFVGGPPTPFGQAAAYALDQYLDQGPRVAQAPSMPVGLVELLGRCFRSEPADRPTDLTVVAEELCDIYAESTGTAYVRDRPASAALLADGLSNQALSMFDLDRLADACRLWIDALQLDRRHSHAVYNLGLIRWRAGQVTDEELVADLDGVRQSHGPNPLDDHLLAQVHLERGDHARAAELVPDIPTMPPDVDLTLVGHTGRVRSLAVSGRFVVSGAEDGTLRVWDISSGDCMLVSAANKGEVPAVAVSENGLVAVSGHANGITRIWDLETGRCRHELRGHHGPVSAVAADGHHALTGGDDGTVRLWDVRTGDCRHVLSGHEGGVDEVALGVCARSYGADSPPDDLPVDMSVRRWNIDTGRCERTMRGLHDGHRVALGSDGLSVWVVGYTDMVLILEPEACHEASVLKRYQHEDAPQVVDDAGCLGLSGSLTGVRVWELDSGRCLRTLEPGDFRRRVTTVAISPDGRLGLWGREDGTIRVFSLPIPGFHAAWSYARPCTSDELDRAARAVDTALGRAARLLDRGLLAAAADELRTARRVPGHERHPRLLVRWRELGDRGRRNGLLAIWQLREVYGQLEFMRPFVVAMTEDNRHALTGGPDGSVRVWDLATGQAVRTMREHTAWVMSIATAGGMAVSASNDGAVRVWNLADGRCLHTMVGHTGDVTSVMLAGRHALSADSEGTLCAWEWGTGECLRIIAAHTGPVDAIALSQDGSYAVSGCGRDMSVRVWDLGTGKLRHTLKRHLVEAKVAISPDNRLVLSTFDGYSVRARDLRDGRDRYTVDSPGVKHLAIAAHGRVACSGNLDGTVRVWELASGQIRHVLSGHDMVESMTVSPDGRLAVTGGTDRTARIWDLDEGRCLDVLEGHSAGVNAVALTADCRYLFTGDWNGTARFWELDWDYQFPPH